MTPEQLNQLIINELNNLKAQDILTIDVSNLCSFADYMVICTATSSRHANALFTKLTQELKNKAINPYHKGRQQQNDWLILDYNDVVVHIMQANAREFYALEKLWFQTSEKAQSA
jgi:ribosome-associated protein